MLFPVALAALLVGAAHAEDETPADDDADGAVLPAPLVDGRSAPPTPRSGDGRPMAPAPRSAPPVSPELVDVAFGVDALPLIGTSTVHQGRDRRAVSVSLVGLSGAIDGIDVSLGASIVAEDVDGIQASAGANIVGGQTGGLQVAAGANVVGGDLDGFQAAGGANVVGGGVNGFQVAPLNVTGGFIDGAQAAVVNVAGDDMAGWQAGVVNVAKGDIEGVQVGLVNVAGNSDASFGLVNVVRNGRTHVDVWGSESGFMNTAFKHGGRYIHNIYGVGWRPWGDCPEWSLLLGIGGHLPFSDRFAIDADLYVQHVSFTGTFVAAPNLMSTARARAVIGLSDHLALTAGVGLNVWTSTIHDGSKYVPGASPVPADPEAGIARVWPGVTVGVQLF